MRRVLSLGLALSLITACSADSTSSNGPEPTGDQGSTAVETPHPGGDPVPLDRLGTANLAPDAPEPEPGIRHRQRLDLDQLDRALETATGFRWTHDNGDQSMLDTLAATLGKPDYIQTTIEDVTPSLLFHKFLD
ncbi:MAG: hypothetical protein QF464_11570, partial [Myxococcota bacterium]|nr:hypothetical protein [Myxococcota bacterium]